MNKNFFNAILTKIQKDINENQDIILKMQNIDNKYCKIKIEINRLIEIIEYYKTKQISNNNKDIVVFCNGNPYVVLNLAMVAILNNSNIKINISNTMRGVNEILLSIINNVLQNEGLKIELFEKNEENEEIVFIDRINDYNLLKSKKKRIIPYQSIDIYSDNDEFEELYEIIYNYALDMHIDVDVFDEEGINSLFEYGSGKIKLILTKDETIVNKYKKEKVFINKNPFKNEDIFFNDEMIKLIVN